MAYESKLSKFLNKKSWIIPSLFVFMCILVVITIVAVELKYLIGKVDMDPHFAFSIGGELCAMIVAIMMTISLLPNYKRHSANIRIFVTLLATGCFVLFLDSMQMVVDGEAGIAWANKVLSILVFSVETWFFFFFWLYVRIALKNKDKVSNILNNVISLTCLIFALLPFVNFFYPFYFSIDEVGVYHRNPTFWWMCRIFLLLVVISVIFSIIKSKEKTKTKIVISVFMGLPLVAIGAGGFNYGVSITYTAMMVSLVLIYVMLFSENEKDLFSTNKELSLATNIQKNMLPSIFPAFPDRKEFDIYASMTPAKEVGGDFYDFFLIDEYHLGLVMADVSDKGVPAALFMMASKIMVQNFAILGQSPKQVLESVNTQICNNNQSEMFVTIWLGVLDLKTGILTAANAGHEKPVLKEKHGKFAILNDKHGIVVGWFKNSKYEEYQIKLEKGSKLFLYTDGVPEATSKNGQLGLNRMVNILNAHKNDDPTTLVNNLKKDIDAFVGEKDQFDDITMLCIEYKGYDEVISYELEADISNLEAMLNPVLAKLAELNVDKKIVYQINISLEEIFSNVINYAYHPNKGTIHISYLIKENPRRLEVTVKDTGKEFNPLEKEDPDINADAKNREIGGLGLFIVKKSMDEVKYQRIANTNILTLTKKI